MQRLTIANCLALRGNPIGLSDGTVDIIVAGDWIESVSPAGERRPEGTLIDGTGLLVTAGLINGHTHSHENFTKGRYENLPLEVWMNFVRPPEPIPYTSRQIYLRTMIGAIESLRTGATTVVDDLNISPVLIPEHVEAVLQAYEDSGIRALVAPGMFDIPFFKTTPFVEEHFSANLLEKLGRTHATPPNEVVAYVKGLLGNRHPRERRVGMAISPSAPQRCSEPYLRRLKELADNFDLPIIIHVQETRLQVFTGEIFFGSTMIEYLGRINFLRPGVSIIHGVWLNPREIEILARSGATLQHNPISNMSLGSGLCPVRELLDAGVNVSLGTDACGSSFTVSMLKTVNGAALMQKLRTADHYRWIGAQEAWAAGTISGAKALGLGDRLGVLAPGMLADLTGYRLASHPFRPLNDPLRQLVYAETGAELSLVLVNGDIVMHDGRFTRFDESALWDEIAEEHEKLLPELERADRSVSEMRSAYEAIYRRCLAQPIPEDTHPALFNTPNKGCPLHCANS
jgi:5-methylthioadenosine/S-adenosylhomocysteine deaminase